MQLKLARNTEWDQRPSAICLLMVTSTFCRWEPGIWLEDWTHWLCASIRDWQRLSCFCDPMCLRTMHSPGSKTWLCDLHVEARANKDIFHLDMNKHLALLKFVAQNCVKSPIADVINNMNWSAACKSVWRFLLLWRNVLLRCLELSLSWSSSCCVHHLLKVKFRSLKNDFRQLPDTCHHLLIWWEIIRWVDVAWMKALPVTSPCRDDWWRLFEPSFSICKRNGIFLSCPLLIFVDLFNMEKTQSLFCRCIALFVVHLDHIVEKKIRRGQDSTGSDLRAARVVCSKIKFLLSLCDNGFRTHAVIAEETSDRGSLFASTEHQEIGGFCTKPTFSGFREIE